MTVVVLKEDFCCSAVFTLKCKSKSSETFFCNRQQHKYFVLLFVPFLYQKQKREKKKKKEGSKCFQCVFSATAILVSKLSDRFADLLCIKAELAH